MALNENTNKVEEIANLLELLNAVVDLIGVPMNEIEKIRFEKFQKRGGFSKRLMLLGKEVKQ